MIFDTDYWNSLNKKEREEVTLNPKQLGYSLGGDPLKNLKAGIFMGTENMELTFFGAPGKGQEKGTPESWGKLERQEMKELARVNEVEVTTHATPNMGGGGASFSGFTGQGFSDEARQKAIDEMGRTADFAADVSGGGPVVFHIDGFERPVFSAGAKEGAEVGKFKSYEQEERKAPLYFVNTKNGSLTPLSKEEEMLQPEKDEKGNIVMDEEGIPKMKRVSFEDSKSEFDKLNPVEKEKYGNEINYFYHGVKQGQEERIKGEMLRSLERVKEFKKKEKHYNDLLEDYEITSSSKHQFFNKLLAEEAKRPGEEQLPLEHMKKISEDPKKYLEENRDKMAEQKRTWEHIAAGEKRNIDESERQLKDYQEITNYGIGKEADTIAQSAMKAYKIEIDKKLKKPLWVAPENWAVERYGSHPREYRKIIKKSRDEMAKMLMKDEKYKMSKSKAKMVAEEHIKGTFDIGHLNMWKKYFQGDDKGFAKWMEKELRPLVRDKIIGHVHLSDNFGYHDEHIELGEGNAPIQEFFKILKEEKFKGIQVAEPGGQREGQLHRVWTSALEMGGSPVYRIDSASKTWTDIGGSYFGRTQSPNFMVGDYAPTKEWTLWSEVPLE